MAFLGTPDIIHYTVYTYIPFITLTNVTGQISRYTTQVLPRGQSNYQPNILAFYAAKISSSRGKDLIIYPFHFEALGEYDFLSGLSLLSSIMFDSVALTAGLRNKTQVCKPNTYRLHHHWKIEYIVNRAC